MSDQPLDMIVIGGGPAGCSAAVNAHEFGLRVRVAEPGELGGQVRAIESIRNLVGGPYSGVELANALAAQICAYGIPVTRAPAVAVQRDGELWTVVCGGGEVLHARALVAATGTREMRFREHPAVTGVGDEVEDRYVYNAPFDELVRRDVVIVGADRVLMSLVDDHGVALGEARIHVLALEDKWYVIEPFLDRLPFTVTRCASIERIARTPSGYAIAYTTHVGEAGRTAAEVVFTNLDKLPNSDLFRAHFRCDGDGYLAPKDYLREPTGGNAYAVGDVAHKDFQRISVAIGDGAYAALDHFYGGVKIVRGR
jgi:thioredoxin reductase